jgi:hypothetical protein
MIGVSGMGGAFALLPAYEADLFGTKNIAAIHGRMLLFSSSAGVFGKLLNLVFSNKCVQLLSLSHLYQNRSLHVIEATLDL